jgi:FAD/FMN-containing dehydrogenase
VQGTTHTFNWLADTVEGGALVSLEQFKDINIEGNQATFGAGVTYSDLILAVDKSG